MYIHSNPGHPSFCAKNDTRNPQPDPHKIWLIGRVQNTQSTNRIASFLGENCMHIHLASYAGPTT